MLCMSLICSFKKWLDCMAFGLQSRIDTLKHGAFLENIVAKTWDPAEAFQHMSPTNRWSDRSCQQELGQYVEAPCWEVETWDLIGRLNLLTIIR